MLISSNLPPHLVVAAQYFNKRLGTTDDLDGLLEGFLHEALLAHPHSRFCENLDCEWAIDPTFIVRDVCAGPECLSQSRIEITTEPVATCPQCGGSNLSAPSGSILITALD